MSIINHATITSIDTDSGPSGTDSSSTDFYTNDQTLNVSGALTVLSGGLTGLTLGVWAVSGATTIYLGQVTVADNATSWSISANGTILGEGTWTLQAYRSSSTSDSLPLNFLKLDTQDVTIDTTSPTETLPGTQTVPLSGDGTVIFGSSHGNQISVADNNTDVLQVQFAVGDGYSYKGILHVTGTAAGITIYNNDTYALRIDGTAAAINSFINNNLTYTFDINSPGAAPEEVSVRVDTTDQAGLRTAAFFSIDVTCFMAGTMIRTPDGEVAVERLKTGDLVLTADGRAMPVRWLGRQTVSTIFGDKLRILPIRIKAGAFRENVPSRDLLVSPDHAILIDDVLAQAAALVNETSIVRETAVPRIFTYYHVELDDHSLIVAENTPVETFVDNVDRLGFDNWAEHEALYPGRQDDRRTALSARQKPASGSALYSRHAGRAGNEARLRFRPSRRCLRRLSGFARKLADLPAYASRGVGLNVGPMGTCPVRHSNR